MVFKFKLQPIWFNSLVKYTNFIKFTNRCTTNFSWYGNYFNQKRPRILWSSKHRIIYRYISKERQFKNAL